MLTDPLLIVNPGSGRHSGRHVGHVTAELTRLGLVPRIVSARTPEETAHQVSSLRSVNQHPFIIVAAGDGTFNAVLNCIEPGTTTLAVVPLGTSNVLAAELGITSIDDGIQRIARSHVRPLPVGLLQLEGAHHYFGLMAGIGVDGAVVRDVRPGEKRLLKQGAFALSALRNACSWDREKMDALSGGACLSCHTVVVCNGTRYGGNFVLAPEGDLLSPGFTVTCVTADGPAGYLRIVRDLFRGRVECSRDMIRMVSCEVEIRGSKPIQIDGDFVGYGPARMTVVADFARIIV
jgi:diacylglycerol kinase (ATP)